MNYNPAGSGCIYVRISQAIKSNIASADGKVIIPRGFRQYQEAFLEMTEALDGTGFFHPMVEPSRTVLLLLYSAGCTAGGIQVLSSTGCLGQYRRIVNEKPPLAGAGSQFGTLADSGESRCI
jgi:hypothetical protein